MTPQPGELSLCFVIDLYRPFIARDEEGEHFHAVAAPFFETLTETLIPLLEMFERLEGDSIPWQLTIAPGGELVEMLRDEGRLARYKEYVVRQIRFGEAELEREDYGEAARREAARFLARLHHTERVMHDKYARGFLPALNELRNKGRLEFLGGSAVSCFLPFFEQSAANLRCQLVTARIAERCAFDRESSGFFPDYLGWSPALAAPLRAHGYRYAIIDSHTALLSEPAPSRATFFPLKTPEGLILLPRDRTLTHAFAALQRRKAYRAPFFDAVWNRGIRPEDDFYDCDDAEQRVPSGFRYFNRSVKVGVDEKYPKNPPETAFFCPSAMKKTLRSQARAFLAKCRAHSAEAGRLLAVQNGESPPPLCLVTIPGDLLGRDWAEGVMFLETLFRANAAAEKSGNEEPLHFLTTAEYLSRLPASKIETVNAPYSSSSPGGYAAAWLDFGNDRFEKHIRAAVRRMEELAARYPSAAGFKERLLNQACREVLLAQNARLLAHLRSSSLAAAARRQIEQHLRNFTAIYDSIGTNRIDTRSLTTLERIDNIYPALNYRDFRAGEWK